MNTHKTTLLLVCCGFILLTILHTKEVHAIPSFARQTHLPCSSCHTIFPELNSFGRFFKLNGYTLTGGTTITVKDTGAKGDLDLETISQVSVMLQTSFSHTGIAQPGSQNDNVSLPQQISAFFGGEISSHLGGFIQVTYDDKSAVFGIDNVDVRYRNQASIGSENLLWGLTLNNNPTVQDLWNSTPAWRFPYASSPTAASPLAATMIEGGLAQQVAGLGAYVLLNNLLYAEVSLYRSAHQGGIHPPNNMSTGIIEAVAPYWRLALQKQFDNQYIEVGGFGMTTSLYPLGVSGLTDTYTDLGVDMNYELPVGENQFAAHSSLIHEQRKLDATYQAKGSSSQSVGMYSFRIVGSYYLHQQLGLSLGYFDIGGDADAALYPPATYTGSATGSPASSGLIPELDFLPWMNTKFALQYVAYNKFNGSKSNYDGDGRNASDNNTVYLLVWVAF